MDIKKELTVYKNELNAVAFRKFTAIEMNLFFSICTKMRDKGLEKIQYSFEELRELSKYKPSSINRFVSDLDRTYTKMLQLNYRVNYATNNDNGFKRFVLFTDFEVSEKNQYVEITTNQNFAYILNEISGNFTKFELEEFTNLRSSYSKTAFRMLKQFRQTGFWKVSIGDFRQLLDVPKSYQMSDIDKKVVKPIIKELSKLFKNLKIKKIKAKKQNKIEYLEFSFKSQDDIRKNGTKTFKDCNGNYYENSIEYFTKKEVKKSFPII